MNLKELAVEIRETNDANGFEAPTWDRLLSKLMLVVTELDEAVAAVKGDGKDPLEEELADAAIRLVDILTAIWEDDWNDRRHDVGQLPHCFEPIETLLWPTLSMVCWAAEKWMAEMVRKTKRNALRGYRHGKVRGDA
jgi:NTP pyrophosphatase (non-canonical NTP hydrolase)